MSDPRRRFPDVDKLPPFDPKATCSKCGSEQVNARYRTDTRAFSGKSIEWICRQCERCGYLWDEQCLPEGRDNASLSI